MKQVDAPRQERLPAPAYPPLPLPWGAAEHLAAYLLQTNDHEGLTLGGVSSDPIPSFVMRKRQIVGRRIRQLRAEQHLSQERLAERAGIARHSVYRTELATHSASLDHLTAIAQALGISLSDLVRE